ncbi:MAG: putative transporter [Verrucomicrobiae bacterium]|nr:putative transporter [Verrucomicrobiae bacterium]
MKLNLYAAGIVIGGGLIAIGGAKLLHLPMAAAAGVFSGATTNTPSLGAAQQALASTPGGDPTLAAMAYAGAYPLAVVGIIGTLMILRAAFKIDVAKEAESFRAAQSKDIEPLERMNLIVDNRNLDGLEVIQIPGLKETSVVISRLRRAYESEVIAAGPHTILHHGDVVMAVGTKKHLEQFSRVIGTTTDENLMQAPGKVSFRRVVLTNRKLLGKTVGELGLDQRYGVTVTRLSRGEHVLTALPDLALQFGDMLQIVGDEQGLEQASKKIGNAVHQLNDTHFAPVFAGLAMGVLLGLYPIQVDWLPAPLRLGLAGGPLLVAILISRLGRIGPLVVHMPMNTNMALRHFGIILFLACVGLVAGEHFFETVFTTEGLKWVGLGIVVTLAPLLIAGALGRKLHGLNFMTLSGLLSGSMTDPPALAFATGMARCESPAIAYAAVYPLTMLLRIVVAQVIALLGG